MTLGGDGGGSGFDLRGDGIGRRLGAYLMAFATGSYFCLRLTGHRFSQEGDRMLRYCTNLYVGLRRHSFRARKRLGYAKSIC